MWNLITCNSHYEDFLKDKEAKRFHKSLQEIKSIVDTSGPKKVPHLKKRSKKAQLKQERQAEINYKNQKLMEKMIIIDGRTRYSDISNGHSYRSLNKESRSKNNVRINDENQKLLERLQNAQPVLSMQNWEKGERHWMHIRSNIQKKGRGYARPNSSFRERGESDLIMNILKRKTTRPVTSMSPDFNQL
jgi:hypothetical protein